MTFFTLASQSNTRNVQRTTPQTQAIPGREADQVRNSAGGYSFKLDNWDKLDRFLIIGTEGGTYYASERALNAGSLTVAKALIQQDGIRVVDRCVEISQSGRAKNNDYALLVMAMAISEGTDATKRYAGNNIHLVARTGTHLMHFTAFANGQRGWGKTLKRAIQNWYGMKTTDQVAFQAIKYQSRDGWSQRDILRLAHPKAAEADVVRNNTYRYIVKGREGLAQGDMVPPVIVAFEQAKTADEATLIKLITDHRLSHEMIPNEMKNRPAVWEALAQHMGTTAMVRNLNKMTAVGLIKPFSQTSKNVVAQLTNVETLRKDRIHPIQLLVALRQYSKGHGDKGSLVWYPDQTIVKTLEDSFYLSFRTVTPSGKNIVLGLDVSGSMSSPVPGMQSITCAEGATVMAMVTARTEPWTQILGFRDKTVELGITSKDTLASAMKKAYGGNFGSTNCAAPMEMAMAQKWDVDAFAIYTDNETYAGSNGHPSQVLTKYRNTMHKPDAKLIVVGMAVNGFTIADPNDKGMLDVVGFDSAAPQLISEFIAGTV